MQNKPSQKNRPKFRFKWLLLALGLLTAAVLIYCWHLSIRIETRFSGRRWNVPSTIYSDITTLYKGQIIRRSDLYKKLLRLGYRETPQEPAQKGEMHSSGPELKVFLNDLNTPTRKRTGFPLRIRWEENRIVSLVDSSRSESIPILELEPEEIMSFYGEEREQRKIISIDDVPRALKYAVLAAEDSRFYQHMGMDLRAVLRAIYTNLRHADIRQGGSTITQQLAKNYFLTPDRTFTRKLKELFLALTMEAMYEKKEILEIYLNEIYLGQKGSISVNGVGEASYFYFGKPVAGLTLAEAATIAGLIKAPNIYNPYGDKALARSRRNSVLESMLEHGWISEREFEEAFSSAVRTAGYRLYANKAPYFTDFLALQIRDLYPPNVLASQGLTIYSTLDTMVQVAAENALRRGLARLEKKIPALRRSSPERSLQGAVVVMQPTTGYVLALVGGRNYGVTQFNRITQARRQPGSAFKPFVFLSGLDRFTPASRLSNADRAYTVDGKQWQPRNYVPVNEPEVSFRTALARSINRATVDLADQVGMEKIVHTAAAFGFSSSIPPYLSVSLGAAEVIPLELARAYCPFAAEGILPYPLPCKEVVDESGEVLERRHMEIERVLSPEKAYMMTSLLRSVVEEGTASSLGNYGIGFPVAGKTGTSSDYKDAWFVGYTPDVLALVWVGFDDGGSVLTSGASAALPIWADLVRSIPQYISGEWFQKPAGVVERMICPESGGLAIRFQCPDRMEEIFLAENVPTEKCPLHRETGVFRRFFKGIKDLFSP